MAGVDGVVLYIGGGEASHSAELMRMSNFFHFRGQEGWLNGSAGGATELATPGTGISIAPGPFLVNSRFPGGAMQSYMGRILTSVNVDTTNVPPGDPRSDLVVMNIEDPYPSDGTFWPFPGAEGSDSRRDGPYAKVRIIQGVPSNTLSIDDLPTNRPERGWTCIPIARLDRPANTGTVTQSMVKNLRSIINPWAGIQLPQELLDRIDDIEDAISELGDPTDPSNPGGQPQKFPVPAISTGGAQCYFPINQNTVYVSDTDWKDWPKECIDTIIIPPWANYAVIYVDIICAYYQTGSSNPGIDANVYMAMRYKAGNSTSQITYNEMVEPLDVYYAATPDKRANRPPCTTNIKLATRMTINPEDRGKVVTASLQVKRLNLSGSRLYNGVLVAVPQVTSGFGIREFKELPS